MKIYFEQSIKAIMFAHTNHIKPFTEAAIFTPSSKLVPATWSRDTGHIGINGRVDVRTDERTDGRMMTSLVKPKFIASMGYHIFLTMVLRAELRYYYY